MLASTGGPAVGKTRLVNAILLILRAKKPRCLLCTPTGRAAKRVWDATSVEARTIRWVLTVNRPRAVTEKTACSPQRQGATLLGALAESSQPAALDTATRLLGDAAVRSEAAVAVLNLASKVGAQDPAAAEAALKKVVEGSGDHALAARAEKMLREGWSTAEIMQAPYDDSVGVKRQNQLAAALRPEDKLVAYLDCGVTARVEGAGGIVVRQLNGKPWTFELPDANPAAGTVAFDGRAIEFALSGLDPARAYAPGLFLVGRRWQGSFSIGPIPWSQRDRAGPGAASHGLAVRRGQQPVGHYSTACARRRRGAGARPRRFQA